MKRIGSKVITLILISVLIIFLVLKDNYNEIISVLKTTNNVYILFGFLIVLLGDLFKSLSITKIIKNEKKEYKFKDGFLLTLQTNFFNGITPFCLGGQPFQVYSLKKYNNVKYGEGTKIIFKDFYSYQIALVILSSLCLFVNNILNVVTFNSVIKVLILIGYLLNLLIALFLIYLPYSKTNGKKIISFIINILSKIKIVKNKDIVLNDLNKYIIDFKENVKNTIKNKKLIIKCISFNLIKIVSLGITTYFCFKAVGSSVPVLTCIILTIITITMASFVPIPGSSGGMEYGFITLFSLFVVNVKLSAVMLIWRSLTYYLLIIVGGFIFALKMRK